MRMQDEHEPSGTAAEKDQHNPHVIPDNIRAIIEMQNAAKGIKPPQRQEVNLNSIPGMDNMPPPPSFDNAHQQMPAELRIRQQALHGNKPQADDDSVNDPHDTIATTKKPVRGQTKMRPTMPPELLKDGEWRRLDFPSNLVPYDIDEIYIRKLSVPDLNAIYETIETNNHSGYIDALDKCCSYDVRELTVPDFIYMQYVIRMSSYTRSPYTIDWTTRYGNDLKSTVKERDLKVVTLNMTKEEYAEWRARGICFPTLRESEYLIETADETEGPQIDMWMLQNAQYVLLPPDAEVTRRMELKLEALRNSPSVDIVADIQEFAVKSEHGVIESVELADDQFKPEAALAFLRNQVMQLRNLAKATSEENSTEAGMAGVFTMLEHAETLEAEANDIAKALEEKRIYVPRKEVVALRSISAMDMFPVAYKKAAAAA